MRELEETNAELFKRLEEIIEDKKGLGQ